MGIYRENDLLGNLCIIWKLNKAQTLKNDSVTFLQFLKLLKTQKWLHIALWLLKLLILKKDSVTFFGLLKFLTSENHSMTSLRLFKDFNFEKWFYHILITRLKFCKIAIL